MLTSKHILFFYFLLTALVGCTTISPMSEKYNCQVDNDCTTAVDISNCCSCPFVDTKSHVKNSWTLKEYSFGDSYGQSKPFYCSVVGCSACTDIPAGAVCKANLCVAPSMVSEILMVCPDCYYQAAQAAYRERRMDLAAEFCGRDTRYGFIACSNEIFKLAMEDNNLSTGEVICRKDLIKTTRTCLQKLAYAWVKYDYHYSVNLCKEMDQESPQFISCITHVALLEFPFDPSRAQEICQSLPGDQSTLCLQDINKQK